MDTLGSTKICGVKRRWQPRAGTGFTGSLTRKSPRLTCPHKSVPHTFLVLPGLERVPCRAFLHERNVVLRATDRYTALAHYGVESGRWRNPPLIWIDPVRLALRFSKSPPSMGWIQGAAGMIHDGESL